MNEYEELQNAFANSPRVQRALVAEALKAVASPNGELHEGFEKWMREQKEMNK